MADVIQVLLLLYIVYSFGKLIAWCVLQANG